MSSFKINENIHKKEDGPNLSPFLCKYDISAGAYDVISTRKFSDNRELHDLYKNLSWLFDVDRKNVSQW